MGKANRIGKNILLALISAVFISPIVIVFFNSFKSKLFINNKPFNSFFFKQWRYTDLQFSFSGLLPSL